MATPPCIPSGNHEYGGGIPRPKGLKKVAKRPILCQILGHLKATPFQATGSQSLHQARILLHKRLKFRAGRSSGATSGHLTGVFRHP
jgi:hypothetical protein